jgi:FtsZ-interacting cell division protein ZipA
MPYEILCMILLVLAGLWLTRRERAAALADRDR